MFDQLRIENINPMKKTTKHIKKAYKADRKKARKNKALTRLIFS